MGATEFIEKGKELKRKRVITEFERIRYLAELRALSNYSLENPLTDEQYKRMMELKEIVLGGAI